MPPLLALFLTGAFIFFLFWRDTRQEQNVTGALWIPLLWMVIIGSRYVSQWLGVFGLSFGAVSLEEGSPLDAVVFFALIAAGVTFLSRRQIKISEILRNNGWLTV